MSKYYCKNCKVKTSWESRHSRLGMVSIYACVRCGRELFLPGDKQPKKRRK